MRARFASWMFALLLLGTLGSCGGSGGTDAGPIPTTTAAITIDAGLAATSNSVRSTTIISPSTQVAASSTNIQIPNRSRSSLVFALDSGGNITLATFGSGAQLNLSAASTALAFVRLASMSVLTVAEEQPFIQQVSALASFDSLVQQIRDDYLSGTAPGGSSAVQSLLGEVLSQLRKRPANPS